MNAAQIERLRKEEAIKRSIETAEREEELRMKRAMMNFAFHLHLENRMRVEELILTLSHECATRIQRMWRGRMGRLYAAQMRRREDNRLIANHAIESDESSRLIEEAERLISQAIVDQGNLLIERAKRDQERLQCEIAEGYIQMMSVQMA